LNWLESSPDCRAAGCRVIGDTASTFFEKKKQGQAGMREESEEIQIKK